MVTDFRQYYALSDADSRGALVVEDGSGSGLDGRRLLRGLERPEAPVLLVPALGRKPLDLIVGTDIATMLISSSVARTLEETGLTGWSTYPVDLRDAAGRTIDRYAGLSVLGRCGPLVRATEPEWQPPLVPGAKPYKVWVGISFPPDSWDGSDFFMAEDETMWVFATDRVRSAIEARRFRNFEFRRITEIQLQTPPP